MAYVGVVFTDYNHICKISCFSLNLPCTVKENANMFYLSSVQ